MSVVSLLAPTVARNLALRGVRVGIIVIGNHSFLFSRIYATTHDHTYEQALIQTYEGAHIHTHRLLVLLECTLRSQPFLRMRG